jgi:hypothetical protein
MYHSLAVRRKLPTHAAYWFDVNKRLINACDAVWVLMLEGWDESIGIREEVDYADIIGKTVRFKAPHNP